MVPTGHSVSALNAAHLVRRPVGALRHACNAQDREDGRTTNGEGETVAALWDEQNRTGIDGAPLSESGRRGARERSTRNAPSAQPP
jgi:hypothetical protein